MSVNSDLSGGVLQTKKTKTEACCPMTLIQKLLLGNQAHSLSQMLLGFHPASLAQLNDLGLWKTTSLGVVRAATSD